MILRKTPLLVYLLLGISVFAFGQKPLNPIEKEVEQRAQDFQKVEAIQLLNPIFNKSLDSYEIDQMVSEAEILEIDQKNLSKILEDRPTILKLNLPVNASEELEILLYEAPLFSESFILEFAAPYSEKRLDLGAHYWGVVKGANNSMVSISISREEIMGMILIDGNSYTLGKLEDYDEHVLYRTNNLLIAEEFSCETTDDLVMNVTKTKDEIDVSSMPGPSNCVNLYVEVDNNIVVSKGGVSQATNYVNGILSQVFLLYTNESINMQLSQMKVWNVTDPYTATSPSSILTQFRNHLSGNYNGDLAHLLSFTVAGGVAYVDVLCFNYYGVAYSGIYSSYSNFPTYSWTVNVVTHELGHNLGSRHTHDCVWGTGNNQPIDCCGANAGYPSSTCSSCNIPNPSGGGTIMSYCHLLSGVGINLNNGFGPEPGNKIRNEVYNASCLISCGTGPCSGSGGDNDGDGSCANVDCDDNNASVYPGATEICDGIDNDCDGQIDEGVQNTYYLDFDGDSYGRPGSTTQACTRPSGYANNASDCDDMDPNIYPGATEICDGQDNDCDGQVDEGVLNTYYADNDGDGYGVSSNSVQGCTTPSGYANIAGDCNDNNNTIYPGAPELCDGLDNDCDGVVDPDSDGDGTPDCNDGCPNDPAKIAPGVCGCGVADTDSDGDGTPDCIDGCPNDPAKIAPGACGCGVADTDTDGDGTPDCNDGCSNDPNKITPGVCGCGVADTDTDGDGTPDCIDGCPNEPARTSPANFYADTDGDGYGDSANSINTCTPPPGYVLNSTDCNDNNSTIYPGAPELCDGLDNDCDGVVDPDSDGDGTPDCNDGCPNDPNKTSPGICGCGVSDVDSDGDGVADCNDGCPNDPNKTSPGVCGCGVSDVDSDGDGTPDCNDACPNEPARTSPENFYADSDGDGYGNPNSSVNSCTQPSGFVTDNTDCNDSNNTVYPGATEICGDALDNNCNGQVDEGCGGCNSAQIDFTDFESGWSIWNDGGSDCRLNKRDAGYAIGTYCVRLRDDSSTSFMTTDNLNLSNYSEITVDFTYYPRSMDNTSEDFWLQISTNGGGSYTTVEEWNKDDEFVNNQRYWDTVVIDGPFTSNTRLRFRCDASSNADWVYIDEVDISGCVISGFKDSGTQEEETIVEQRDFDKEEVQINNILVYPNPASNIINIDFENQIEEELSVQIFDIDGKLWKSLKQEELLQQGDLKIDISNLPTGSYYLRLATGEYSVVKNIMKI